MQSSGFSIPLKIRWRFSESQRKTIGHTVCQKFRLEIEPLGNKFMKILVVVGIDQYISNNMINQN